MCSLEYNWQYVSFDWDNGLVPNRWQASIWTTGDIDYWHIYVSLSLIDLMGFRTRWDVHITVLIAVQTFTIFANPILWMT